MFSPIRSFLRNVMDIRNLSSNWKKLQQELKTNASSNDLPATKPSKRKLEDYFERRTVKRPHREPAKARPRGDGIVKQTKSKKMQASHPPVNGNAGAPKVSDPAKDSINAGQIDK
jgi:hypothetical protein